jgi:hypothetical protein
LDYLDDLCEFIGLLENKGDVKDWEDSLKMYLVQLRVMKMELRMDTRQ